MCFPPGEESLEGRVFPARKIIRDGQLMDLPSLFESCLITKRLKKIYIYLIKIKMINDKKVNKI